MNQDRADAPADVARSNSGPAQIGDSACSRPAHPLNILPSDHECIRRDRAIFAEPLLVVEANCLRHVELFFLLVVIADVLRTLHAGPGVGIQGPYRRGSKGWPEIAEYNEGSGEKQNQSPS